MIDKIQGADSGAGEAFHDIAADSPYPENSDAAVL
jgi:hypothetical protein